MENSILNKQVSKLKGYSDVSPSSINLLDYLNDHSLKDQILAIRATVNEDEQKHLKAMLPAVMISGTFSARGEAGLIAHSGLISFDIDHVADMEGTFNKLVKIPYLAYCAKSARGKGYWGIFAISNKAKHKAHFAAMQIYFQELGINIDPAPSNVASLRGYSYDENAYFNHDPQIFNLLYEPEPAKRSRYNPTPGYSNEDNPFDHFNAEGDIEALLLAHGWTYQHTKGTRKRYSRPGKNIGVSADYCTSRKLFYVFSSDPSTGVSRPQAAYNNVTIFCLWECNGDYKLCRKKLLELGYGRNFVPKKNFVSYQYQRF
jgi:hypothetical protein